MGRYLTPIPYREWQPELEKQGFIGLSQLSGGDSFGHFASGRVPFRGVSFQKNGETEEALSFSRNLVRFRYVEGERDCYEVKALIPNVEPEGWVSFRGLFFEDGSMLAKYVEARIFDVHGRNIPEGTVMRHAAQDIAKRAKVDYWGGYASRSWETGGMRPCDDLNKIVQAIEGVKTFHRQVHLAYLLEGQRIAREARGLDFLIQTGKRKNPFSK